MAIPVFTSLPDFESIEVRPRCKCKQPSQSDSEDLIFQSPLAELNNLEDLNLYRESSKLLASSLKEKIRLELGQTFFVVVVVVADAEFVLFFHVEGDLFFVTFQAHIGPQR